MRALMHLDRAVAAALRMPVIILITLLFFLLLSSILLRLISVSMSGPLELVEFLIIWIVLLTTVSLWRDHELYKVTLIEDLMPGLTRFIQVIVEVLKLAFCALLIFHGAKYALAARELTSFWQFDKIYAYSALPICGALMLIYNIRDLCVSVRSVFIPTQP